MLDTTKSMGADNVHPKILSECRYEIAEILCSLMQNSWEKGEISEDWNCANITAIHKKMQKVAQRITNLLASHQSVAKY